MESYQALLFAVGATLFAAWLARTYISERFRFPAVTLYVILGVLLGVSIFGVYSERALEVLDFVSTIGIGLIAFVIGSELDARTLRKLGTSIILIAIFESLAAFVLVTGAVYLMMPGRFSYALVLGSVASATAPAATVAVIRQYRAKGPLTSTVMGVVGIDDAVALIIFVFSSLFAENVLRGLPTNVFVLLLRPTLTIAESLVIGGAAGFASMYLLRKVRDPDGLLMASFAIVLMLLSSSRFLGLSELLTVMSFSVVLVNANPVVSHRIRSNLEKLSPIVLPLFFILAGAHLDVRLIGSIGLIGLVYTAARAAGKISGAYLGAVIGRAERTVRRYVGFSLIPQVGVAVALALAIRTRFDTPDFGAAGHELASIVINILLFTTLITETVGPFLTRATLSAAGEIEKGA